MALDREKVLQLCNEWSKNTLMETLEIEYIDAGEGFLKAKMPVNSRVHQPMGLLHGGATVALAESVGSAASLMFINTEKQEVRGIEISANHLKSKRDGIVLCEHRVEQSRFCRPEQPHSRRRRKVYRCPKRIRYR